MFNIGLKRDLKIRRRVNQDNLGSGNGNQMTTQVKKILEQKGQGLILMVRG